MKVGDQFTINNHEIVVNGNPQYGYFLQSANNSSVKYRIGEKDKEVVYPTLKDLEYAIYKVELAYLETHKIVLDFQLYLGGFNYTVYTTGTNRYFLRNKSGNDAIFIHLGINNPYLWCKQFISSPLLDDVFPECETLDDLSCIVRALLKELLNRMGKEDPTPQKILRMTDGLSLLQVETKPKLIKL